MYTGECILAEEPFVTLLQKEEQKKKQISSYFVQKVRWDQCIVCAFSIPTGMQGLIAGLLCSQCPDFNTAKLLHHLGNKHWVFMQQRRFMSSLTFRNLSHKPGSCCIKIRYRYKATSVLPILIIHISTERLARFISKLEGALEKHHH